MKYSHLYQRILSVCGWYRFIRYWDVWLQLSRMFGDSEIQSAQANNYNLQKILEIPSGITLIVLGFLMHSQNKQIPNKLYVNIRKKLIDFISSRILYQVQMLQVALFTILLFTQSKKNKLILNILRKKNDYYNTILLKISIMLTNSKMKKIFPEIYLICIITEYSPLA